MFIFCLPPIDCELLWTETLFVLCHSLLDLWGQQNALHTVCLSQIFAEWMKWHVMRMGKKIFSSQSFTHLLYLSCNICWPLTHLYVCHPKVLTSSAAKSHSESSGTLNLWCRKRCGEKWGVKNRFKVVPYRQDQCVWQQNKSHPLSSFRNKQWVSGIPHQNSQAYAVFYFCIF